VRDTDEARAKATLARAKEELLAVVGDDVYSTDGRVMEEILGDLLKERGYTIAAAESCTGGLFTSRLTDVPGSSTYVRASVVAYAYEDKTALLGVPTEMLETHGAVSEPVAVAMAEGIRARTGADVTIGITGIAGPGGGTPDKPVGTVMIAAIVPGQPAYVRTYTFLGGQFVLEPKELVKERLGFSPDLADALSNTYDEPDLPALGVAFPMAGGGKVLRDRNPFTARDLEHNQPERVRVTPFAE